jgi:hypothetical protein
LEENAGAAKKDVKAAQLALEEAEEVAEGKAAVLADENNVIYATKFMVRELARRKLLLTRWPEGRNTPFHRVFEIVVDRFLCYSAVHKCAEREGEKAKARVAFSKRLQRRWTGFNETGSADVGVGGKRPLLSHFEEKGLLRWIEHQRSLIQAKVLDILAGHSSTADPPSAS